MSGAGVSGLSGAGALTFGGLQISGAGAKGAVGAGTLTFGALQLSGVGARGAAGTGSLVLGALQINGTGVKTSVGVGAILLPALQVAGAGGVAAGVTGAGTLVFSAFQVSGGVAPPPDVYQYRNGTAYDSLGRMMVLYLEPWEPLPGNEVYIMGIAHGPFGQRYVTVWPATVAYKDGFAFRADGVQLIWPDGDPVGALAGLPVTDLGELAVSDLTPVRWVEGVGIDAAGRLTINDIGA